MKKVYGIISTVALAEFVALFSLGCTTQEAVTTTNETVTTTYKSPAEIVTQLRSEDQTDFVCKGDVVVRSTKQGYSVDFVNGMGYQDHIFGLSRVEVIESRPGDVISSYCSASPGSEQR